jgi:hypothetical protein
VLCKNNSLPSSSLSLSHVSGNCKSSPGKEEDKTAEGVGKVKVRGKRKYTSADNRGGETKKKKLSARSVSCSCCFGRGPCRLPALLIIDYGISSKSKVSWTRGRGSKLKIFWAIGRSHTSNHGVFAKWVYLHEAHGRPPPRGLSSGPSSQPSRRVVLSQLPRIFTMETESRQPKGREGAVSELNAAVEAMNLAKTASTITPIKAVFGSVSALLTLIRVCLLLFYNDLLQVHT